MAKLISETYKQAAIEGMSLNITDDEMFILLPSEMDSEKYYRVEMDEQTMQPTSCCCLGHKRWGKCKHFTIIADAFAGYVAPATTPVVESATQQEEPRITEVEAGRWFIINRNTQVWKDAESGKWFAVGPTANALEIVLDYLDKQSAVKAAEQIVAQSQDKPSAQEVEQQWNTPLLAQKARMKRLADERFGKRDITDAPLNGNGGFNFLKVS